MGKRSHSEHSSSSSGSESDDNSSASDSSSSPLPAAAPVEPLLKMRKHNSKHNGIMEKQHKKNRRESASSTSSSSSDDEPVPKGLPTPTAIKLKEVVSENVKSSHKKKKVKKKENKAPSITLPTDTVQPKPAKPDHTHESLSTAHPAASPQHAIAEAFATAATSSPMASTSSSETAQLFAEVLCDVADAFNDIALKFSARAGLSRKPKTAGKDVNRAKRIRDPNEPRRPPSGYFLYCEHMRKTLKEQHPEKSYRMVDLAEMWTKLPQEDKATWELTAKQKKESYQHQMEVYRTTTNSITPRAEPIA